MQRIIRHSPLTSTTTRKATTMRGQFSWFKQLFGFEESLSQVHALLAVERERDGERLRSLANDRSFAVGRFATPSLAELRAEAMELLALSHPHTLALSHTDTHTHTQGLTHDHIAIGDVLSLHGAHPRALFQAASQFNCLEFASPKAVPELGVEIYAMDRTQGPACAIACAPGAVFRNYFVRVNNNNNNNNSSSTTTSTTVSTSTTEDESDSVSELGQRRDRQIDNLDALADALNNAEQRYWEVENGYVFSRGSDHLTRLNARLSALSQQEIDRLRDLIKLGVHRDVQVVFSSMFEEIPLRVDGEPLVVTQAYASALSCAYSGIANEHWEPLAQLVLDAMYEATLWAALCNFLRHEGRENSRDVFLTFLGGGVFGNDMRWIRSAIARAIAILARLNVPLRVHICHYRSLNRDTQSEIDSMVAKEIKNLS